MPPPVGVSEAAMSGQAFTRLFADCPWFESTDIKVVNSAPSARGRKVYAWRFNYGVFLVECRQDETDPMNMDSMDGL
jgi:hypothetical protein